MKDALSRFSRFNPDVRITVVSIPDSIETPKDMYDILRRNDIDCFCAPKDIEIDEKKYGFYTLNYSHLCLAAPIGNSLYGADSVSLNKLENQELVINGFGRKEIYDPIRRILSSPDRHVKVISSPTLMTMNTINSCIENNQLLLTFNHWRGLHPCLHFIDIVETFEVPYGILYLKDNFLKENEQYEEKASSL